MAATLPSEAVEGGPGSPARPMASGPHVVVAPARTARRIRADRWASRLVVVGGVVVIASILAILVVIVSEVWPLFRPPTAVVLGTVGAAGPPPVPGDSFGVDEHRELAYRVTADGRVEFAALRGAAVPAPVVVEALAGSRVTAVTTAGKALLLGTADGRSVGLDVQFQVTFPRGTRTVTPQVEAGAGAALDPEGRRPVRALTGATPESGPVTVAQLGPTELAVVAVTERKGLVGGGTREETRARVEVPVDGEVTALRLDGRGEELFVGSSRGQVLRYDVRDRRAPALLDTVATSRGGVPVTALGFLVGDRTLVVGDRAGGVSTWQAVPSAAGGERRLTRVHVFEPQAAPVVSVSASRRDKGFVTADAAGGIAVRYGTSGQTLLRLALAGEGRGGAVVSPKGDALVAAGGDGRLTQVELHNPHPEVTLRTLFAKVWYEGYAEPAHVWQSTGGTDDFEAKLGLTPLIWGTLKGTGYALVFAVPMALLAALYVSEFMHPRLKGAIKPVVEIMAALPSVVLGFLAGLWLAPMVERVVPGLFLMPVIVPVVILVALAGWRLLPRRWRSRARPGTEVAVLVPAVAGATALAFWLGGVAERALLGGSYRAWLLAALGLTYDQRNCIVVGLAMGFAVIPIIFTIAEDSLANVPQHLRGGSLALGATRWQTALRIVLPSASPGIFSAVMIGFGRAVGETMIVLMATGNTPVMDWSIFNGFRALSANVAVELPEAPEGGTLFRVLFLAALLLFAFTFVVNTVAELVRLRLRARYRYL